MPVAGPPTNQPLDYRGASPTCHFVDSLAHFYYPSAPPLLPSAPLLPLLPVGRRLLLLVVLAAHLVRVRVRVRVGVGVRVRVRIRVRARARARVGVRDRDRVRVRVKVGSPCCSPRSSWSRAPCRLG